MMRIPFGSLPSRSTRFLDDDNDWTRVRSFYPQNYSVESIASFARVRPALDSRHRDALCTALAAQQEHWGGNSSGVAQLASGAVAVITGQQTGLFTGPHYTVLKAITVIKLASALTEAGVAAVPIFWIASEDHDYQEIEWLQCSIEILRFSSCAWIFQMRIPDRADGLRFVTMFRR